MDVYVIHYLSQVLRSPVSYVLLRSCEIGFRLTFLLNVTSVMRYVYRDLRCYFVVIYEMFYGCSCQDILLCLFDILCFSFTHFPDKDSVFLLTLYDVLIMWKRAECLRLSLFCNDSIRFVVRYCFRQFPVSGVSLGRVCTCFNEIMMQVISFID